jgi:hypothetical protein
MESRKGAPSPFRLAGPPLLTLRVVCLGGGGNAELTTDPHAVMTLILHQLATCEVRPTSAISPTSPPMPAPR